MLRITLRLNVDATFSRRRCTPAAILFAVVCMLGTGSRLDAQEATSSQMASGRLATVEPSLRRVTLVPDGEIRLFELFLAESGEISHDDRTVSLSELVLHVGRRVTVKYRQEGDRHLVEQLIVEGAG